MAKQRHFFMCPPAYYSSRYLINDWSRRHAKRGVNAARAMSEWVHLYGAYLSLGAQVEIVEPRENCPEMTFLGDSIFLYGRHAVVSNFLHRARQKEAVALESWAVGRGFAISHMPKDVYFEGNAETIALEEKLLMGCGVRSSKAAATHLQRILDAEVVPLELRPPFVHLDQALLPLGRGVLAYFPLAFTEDSAAAVRGLSQSLIEVNPEEATALACNSMVVEGTVIMRADFRRLRTKFRSLGFRTLVTPLSEALKVGGAVKCHTLEHYSCDDL